MKSLSFLPGCSRKEPTQQRGEDRVAALLTAAVAEFSAKGYEAATMSSIARRAKSPIGSLYQFFPNKQALARALRTRQIMDAEQIWVCLETRAVAGNVIAFVGEFVERMVQFVDQHPAFLPLLDAPLVTRPVGPRNRLRKQMERVLKVLRPRLAEDEGTAIAEIVLTVNKAMMGLYAQSRTEDRAQVTAEYTAVLSSYLSSRLGTGSVASERPGLRRSRRAAVGGGV